MLVVLRGGVLTLPLTFDSLAWGVVEGMHEAHAHEPVCCSRLLTFLGMAS